MAEKRVRFRIPGRNSRATSDLAPAPTTNQLGDASRQDRPAVAPGRFNEYMMLGDADAERMTAVEDGVRDVGPQTGGFRKKLSTRELAGVADKAAKRATVLGRETKKSATKMASSAVTTGARKVYQLPFLTAFTRFGGRRAPRDDDDDDDGENGKDPDKVKSSGSEKASGPQSSGDDDPSKFKTRKVYINTPNSNSHFSSNYVSTTKYSPLNAVPKFLYEQFTRFANAYFLIIGILYTIDKVTPIFTFGRYSTLCVLAVVVLLSGVKEAIEDFRRYREDRRVNREITHVLGGEGKDRWDAVKVGDIVKVFDKEQFPADILLVASSNDDGLAFIETKQLDGESNLKVKVARRDVSKRFASKAKALLAKGVVECECPNDRLYKFEGTLTLEPSTDGVNNTDEHEPLIPLGPENLLIRGASLRNTEWVLGLVLNTGRDTKLMQNMKPRPRKNSRLEKETNRHFVVSLLLQICIVIALAIRSSQICEDLFGQEKFAWYLNERSGCSRFDSFVKFFTFFLTFSSLIPMSLYVSMEIVRGLQTYFMDRDSKMRDPATGVRAEVRTSNLNEELGVVHYVFSDKTGTLTANRMDFKKCSVGGQVYEWAETASPGAVPVKNIKHALKEGPMSTAALNFSQAELEMAEMTFRLLAICHSVIVDSSADTNSSTEGSDQSSSHMPTDDVGNNEPTSEGSYRASSPDEAALVVAAKAFGYRFVGRSNRYVMLSVFGNMEKYELLEILDFDSTRKRMSVITRTPEGIVRIFTKGADSVIFGLLHSGQTYEDTSRHLHEFATEGLRTLCLAYADLDNDWYADWSLRYAEAMSSLRCRDEAVAAVVAEVERDLVLLGATAIEDKLQDGVPETLRQLERAGVKVWVLTGDKQETAINVGISCGVLDSTMDIVIINENSIEGTAAQIDRAIGRWSALRHDGMQQCGLVIDGQTLHWAMEPELQKKLIALGRLARTVVACRVSPKQKTEIVELVRRYDKDKITLAIGDGANDVGMIQAAHVGVGIVGLEGREAKLASDFSIGQFRFLGRLMLVHGRWSYKRLSKMALYIIYKNALLVMTELYWATFTGYSGQPLLDPMMAGLYNLFISSVPPIVLGALDQELPADYILAFPEIYRKGQQNTAYSFRVYISWLVTAIWQSALIFYLTYWGFGDMPVKNGQSLGMWAFGVIIFTTVILVVHTYVLLYQSSWTKLTVSIHTVSSLSWFVLGPLFSSKAVALDGGLSPPLYFVVMRIFADPRTWMIVGLSLILSVTPDLLWKYTKRTRYPDLKMLVQELADSGITRDEIMKEDIGLPRLPSFGPASPTGSTAGPVTFVKRENSYRFSGFNFDNDESGVVLRHAYGNAKDVRRIRMRFLKRAGSDTELDVQGVQTSRPSPSPSPVQFDRSVKRRFIRNPNEKINLTSHRRSVSDGAVLAESNFERLTNGQDTRFVDAETESNNRGTLEDSVKVTKTVETEKAPR